MTEPQHSPAWLVLPTYNEADNIEPFVAAARSNLPADARILIVDDGSPDGTGERADRLAERHASRRSGRSPRPRGRVASRCCRRGSAPGAPVPSR
jgi:dolichol-phosphate mannosyltransferase